MTIADCSLRQTTGEGVLMCPHIVTKKPRNYSGH